MSTSLPPRIYADLVGKPYADHARGPEAYDCWGLLQAVLARLGHKPTDFPSRPDLLRQALSDEWQPVEPQRIEPGDGILLRSVDPKYQWHIGIVLNGYQMLHAREGANACIERFDQGAYKRRVVGFYRFRGLPE